MFRYWSTVIAVVRQLQQWNENIVKLTTLWPKDMFKDVNCILDTFNTQGKVKYGTFINTFWATLLIFNTAIAAKLNNRDVKC